jgi:hypothetical protein
MLAQNNSLSQRSQTARGLARICKVLLTNARRKPGLHENLTASSQLRARYLVKECSSVLPIARSLSFLVSVSKVTVMTATIGFGGEWRERSEQIRTCYDWWGGRLKEWIMWSEEWEPAVVGKAKIDLGLL